MRPPIRRCSGRGGFTLIELLVVIGIIIVLMSIFLPALMRVWETYNSMRCQSNLNNIGKAIAAHTEENRGAFPTGGGDFANPRFILSAVTGKGRTNEPGTKLDQDWGWAYQILRNMGEDKVWIGQNDAEVRAFLNPLYFCPSRRSASLKNNLAMIDYAGNAGCWSFTDPTTGDPITGDVFVPDSFTVPSLGAINMNVNLPSPAEPYFPVKNGIFIKGRVGTQTLDTLVEKRHVYDGHSYTILVSEKRMNSHMYNMPSLGDRHGYCSGYSSDTLRTGDQRYLPARDERDDPNLQIPDGFGAAHPTAFNALFSDGHVQRIRYNMSLDMRTANVRPPTMPLNGIGPWANGAGPASPTIFGGPVNLTLFQRLCHRSDAQETPQANFGD